MSDNLPIGRTALVPLTLGCLVWLGSAEALAQSKGKLGTAGVEILTSDQVGGGKKLVVVRRNGRDFAKYSAPAGTQGVLLCCTFGNCRPIGPNTALFCDIVVNCAGWACFPE